jgi:phosphoribosylformimino-5-aminoimidazole carboxamide ribotide isomerase
VTILFPAIDLKGGRCVRLERGAMATARIYNEDPADQARTFEGQGFEYLHVVDLDGAVSGATANADAVRAILGAVTIPVQLGGGIREMSRIEAWLAAGVSRVILGTAALRDPALVTAACRRFPGRVAVGIDARNGRVAVEGWAEQSELSALDLARRMEEAGAAAIVHTDIERDGMLAGLNLEASLALARSVATPVIASGGLASMDDIARLASPEMALLEGAISGRALYDGRIDAAAALAMLKAAGP